MLPSFINLSLTTPEISTPCTGKRKEPPSADPAAAGGASDEDYQRIQSYYVCAQEKDPVLFVVQHWFAGKNRYAFDAMQKAAGLQLKLNTNDFYPLCGAVKVQFETVLQCYRSYVCQMNAFCQTREPTSLHPLPGQMQTAILNKTKVSADTFVGAFACALDRIMPSTEPCTPFTPMHKYRVPAQPDSMVFFTGPHMVDSTPVRRLVCYVHSVSENTARDILDSFPTYTSHVKDMKYPPNAQGKKRSNLVDAYLKQRFQGKWGWTQTPGLLIDKASIDIAPEVTAPNRELVDAIRRSFNEDSCYVATNVLANNPEAEMTAVELETHILHCIAMVIDAGLKTQEELKRKMVEWLATYPGGMDAFLAYPEDPTTHEKVLKCRLKLGDCALMTSDLKEYAESIVLRSTRKPTSASWEVFDGYAFTWPTDIESGNQKILRSKCELQALLTPVNAELLQHSVADGPLARLNGDETQPKDMWQLVKNIGGLKQAAKLRRRLYLAGKIAHPHIGHWVSPMKPWNPPLTNPVGNWQNVYMLLTLGMFDSHYMPQHNVLRSALRPIVEQVWHASSRKPFKKVLFAPERFNVRELPEGGQALQWHIDQNAIAPACPTDAPPNASTHTPEDEEDEAYVLQSGFLDDA